MISIADLNTALDACEAASDSALDAQDFDTFALAAKAYHSTANLLKHLTGTDPRPTTHASDQALAELRARLAATDARNRLVG